MAGVDVDRRLVAGIEDVAAGLLDEGVQAGRGFDVAFSGDHRAPDAGVLLVSFLAKARYSSQVAGGAESPAASKRSLR